VGYQKDEEKAGVKAQLFFRAAIGVKLFPHEQAFAMTLKALSEGTDADGGYLVTPEFRTEVLRQLHHNGIMRPEVNVIPVTTDSVNFNSEDGRPSVSWGSENTSISTTTAGLAQTTISVHRMNSLMYLSRELVADSNPSVIDWIRAEFVDSVRNEEDAVIIGGSGSGRPKGLTQISGFTAFVNDATYNFEDWVNLEHTLPIQYRLRGTSKWYMNDLTLRDARKMKDDQGMPIFLRSLDGATPNTLLGYPIVIHNNFPEGTVFFGDLKRTYILLDRQQMSVETTIEGGDTFAKHQVGMKITERIGGDSIRKEALVKGSVLSA
jgi:HK97 family phage major capsid protein